MDIRKTPIPVNRVLRQLGSNIRAARLRRRIAMSIVAQRASISRATLDKIERGDSGVSIGGYAAVLFHSGAWLNVWERYSRFAEWIPLGMRLAAQSLPKRIRSSGQRRNLKKQLQSE